MNNLTNFSVFLESKNQNVQIGTITSISRLRLNLNGDLIRYHI